MSPTLFAVVFVGRQGSSYLQGILDAHPDAACAGEIFAENGLMDSNGCSDVAAFLDDWIHSKPLRASGFKLPWLSFERYPQLWELLRHNRYHLIHLMRGNKLDQYISMRLAQINNAWRSDYARMNSFHFKADPNDLFFFYRRWMFRDSMLRAAVASFPHMHMTYEELIEDYSPALDFLDLPRLELTCPYERQRKGAQSEIIENYHALKEQFRGTELEAHFVD